MCHAHSCQPAGYFAPRILASYLEPRHSLDEPLTRTGKPEMRRSKPRSRVRVWAEWRPPGSCAESKQIGFPCESDVKTEKRRSQSHQADSWRKRWSLCAEGVDAREGERGAEMDSHGAQFVLA